MPAGCGPRARKPREEALTQRLIIDADPGIGDALAIAVALLDPEVDLVGITPVPGVTTGENASRNVQAIVNLLDPPKWPRLGWVGGHSSSSVAIGGPNPQILNGPGGLGDLAVPVAEPHQHHDSAKLLIDLVKAYPHELTLLTLGPLTNLELAVERYPELLMELKELVIQGGSVSAGGDVTATAEFNIYSAPEAARSILNMPATRSLVPLDITQKVSLTYSQCSRLIESADASVARLLERTLPYAFRAYHEHLGVEGLPLPELVALTSIVQPRLFQRRGMSIDVEIQGELTRGVTVFDRRRRSPAAANIEVLSDVDAQGVLDYLARVLSRRS
jgi:inosine-uridine nucleoside N-ribohydrolase